MIMNPTSARLTALDLAMQFRERAEARGGTVWLSAKQVAFLLSLATPVYRGFDPNAKGVNTDVVSELSHGRRVITAYMPDGELWQVVVNRTGAGQFGKGI